MVHLELIFIAENLFSSLTTSHTLLLLLTLLGRGHLLLLLLRLDLVALQSSDNVSI